MLKLEAIRSAQTQSIYFLIFLWKCSLKHNESFVWMLFAKVCHVLRVAQCHLIIGVLLFSSFHTGVFPYLVRRCAQASE